MRVGKRLSCYLAICTLVLVSGFVSEKSAGGISVNLQGGDIWVGVLPEHEEESDGRPTAVAPACALSQQIVGRNVWGRARS
jgi:hypothetical protein